MKFAAGVKLSVPLALIVTVPLGEVAAVTVKVLPSTSVSLARTVIGDEAPESSSTVRSGVAAVPSLTATGASLTGVTARKTVAVAVPPWPSEIE